MVKYIKTEKGYFYKILQNGNKKRISKEEYLKKKVSKKTKIVYKMKGGMNGNNNANSNGKIIGKIIMHNTNITQKIIIERNGMITTNDNNLNINSLNNYSLIFHENNNDINLYETVKSAINFGSAKIKQKLGYKNICICGNGNGISFIININIYKGIINSVSNINKLLHSICNNIQGYNINNIFIYIPVSSILEEIKNNIKNNLIQSFGNDIKITMIHTFGVPINIIISDTVNPITQDNISKIFANQQTTKASMNIPYINPSNTTTNQPKIESKPKILNRFKSIFK